MEQSHSPPLKNVSYASSDSAILALRTEVVTLKDYINNMHGVYQVPQPFLFLSYTLEPAISCTTPTFPQLYTAGFINANAITK